MAISEVLRTFNIVLADSSSPSESPDRFNSFSFKLSSKFSVVEIQGFHRLVEDFRQSTLPLPLSVENVETYVYMNGLSGLFTRLLQSTPLTPPNATFAPFVKTVWVHGAILTLLTTVPCRYQAKRYEKIGFQIETQREKSAYISPLSMTNVLALLAFTAIVAWCRAMVVKDIFTSANRSIWMFFLSRKISCGTVEGVATDDSGGRRYSIGFSGNFHFWYSR